MMFDTFGTGIWDEITEEEQALEKAKRLNRYLLRRGYSAHELLGIKKKKKKKHSKKRKHKRKGKRKKKHDIFGNIQLPPTMDETPIVYDSEESSSSE
jgi:hypothetical protein